MRDTAGASHFYLIKEFAFSTNGVHLQVHWSHTPNEGKAPAFPLFEERRRAVLTAHGQGASAFLLSSSSA